MENMSKTKQLVFAALFVALVFVFTAFINVRLPIAANGGLIHLGNVPLFVIAILYGKKFGALAGGVGMALFDLMGGWLLWAPFTLVIVALMGYAVGAICEKRQGLAWYAVAFVVATLIKIVGYYLAEMIIFGNALVPLASVPGNLVQMGVAILAVLPIADKLKRTFRVVKTA